MRRLNFLKYSTALFFCFLSLPYLWSLERLNQVFEPIFENAELIAKQKLIADPQVSLCLQSIPKKTRFFLYRRFSELALNQSADVRAEVSSKFSIMSYLACRESSGRVVAQAAHCHEGDSRACHYGNSFWDLRTAFQKEIFLRKSTGSSSYFDHSTNGGLFQVSADQVDESTERHDPELLVHKQFVSNVIDMLRMTQPELAKTCGIADLYEPVEYEVVLNALNLSLAQMVRIIQEGSKFEEIGDLVWFHTLQTACPNFNLELAKLLHTVKGKKYFGPLNNTRNSKDCGKEKSLCDPILKGIGFLINI